VLAGPNGAGKTQLLKLIAGSVWPEPRKGTVRSYRWRGERHAVPAEVREEIGYIGPERQDRYERYGWNPTIEQVVGTGLYRTDIPLDPLTRADRGVIAGLLGRIGIAVFAQRRFLTLSYGERRLALLARALAARPKLLLLDELLNGLDGERRKAALGWLSRTRRSALPWVLTTHRIEDVPVSATHALLLDDGRIVYRGRIERAPLRTSLSAVPMRGAAGRGSVGEAGQRAAVTARARRSAPAQSLVRLERASVYLEGRRVLEAVSLEIARGECWVIHGPNGSGKSTLLRTLYGDHGVAAGGRIERAGIEPGVSLDEFKRRVGFVAPHLQASLAATTSLLAPESDRSRGCAEPRQLTVCETVLSGLHASFGLGKPPSLADRRVARRALADFGLGSLGERPLRELSYGQLRRVLFARAWINRPALLLLDEPFSGLDAATREELKSELEGVAERGVSIVIATHHRQEWPRCATCELELRESRVRYCGPVRRPGSVTSLVQRAAARRGAIAKTARP